MPWSGEVRFSDGDRAMYSTDSSSYRQVPIGVVIPRTVDDVVAAVEVCRRHDVPVLPRGGGTSLAGQCCNVAVVLDFSKYLNRHPRPGPGAAARPRAARPDPRPPPRSRRGGGRRASRSARRRRRTTTARSAAWSATTRAATTRSCRSSTGRVRGWRTTWPSWRCSPTTGCGCASGPRRRTRSIGSSPAGGRRGRDLPRPPRPCATGTPSSSANASRRSRGACRATTSTACCRRTASTSRTRSPAPRARASRSSRRRSTWSTARRRARSSSSGFEDLYAAAAQIVAAREHRPLALEGFDEVLIQDNITLGIHEDELRMLPDGRGWLMAEFGGDDKSESDDKARAFMDDMRRRPGHRAREAVRRPAPQRRKIWEVRESGLGATAYVPGKADTFEGWEDSAVPPEHLARVPADLRGLLRPVRLRGARSTGTSGRGASTRGSTGTRTRRTASATWRRFLDEASDLVAVLRRVAVGRARRRPVPRRAAPEDVRRRSSSRRSASSRRSGTRTGRMNPGKVVDPNPIVSNLRLGHGLRAAAGPAPTSPTTGRRELRARRHPVRRRRRVPPTRKAGTMCPSFMVDPRREALDARPGAPALRDDARRRDRAVEEPTRSSRRSTCACRARAARPNARSTSTWPRTRPSSSRITTAAGCGPGRVRASA